MDKLARSAIVIVGPAILRVLTEMWVELVYCMSKPTCISSTSLATANRSTKRALSSNIPSTIGIHAVVLLRNIRLQNHFYYRISE